MTALNGHDLFLLRVAVELLRERTERRIKRHKRKHGVEAATDTLTEMLGDIEVLKGKLTEMGGWTEG